jgi:para-nitrobenzyl esterase
MDVIRTAFSGFTLKIVTFCLVAIFSSGSLGGSSDGSNSYAKAQTPPKKPSNPVIANTSLGTFKGESKNDMRVFKGIRYGEAERFASPTLALRFKGIIELSDFGDACAQPVTTFGRPSPTENCLFLNVYAPQQPGDYPVMAWIHGGALLGGDGGADWDPERLVDQGVVVVTLNYRLGSLGFLPHSELGDSNFGFQDQQLALRWIQQNISAFNGDPDNVTIFGESAGGHSVLSHLASPTAAGLFHRAIVQSGSYSGNQYPLKLPTITPVDPAAELAFDGETRIGQPIAQRVRDKEPEICAVDVALLDCLRAVDLNVILTAQSEILSERRVESILPAWDPDNALLPRSINAALASGDINKVPVLMGSNLDEGDLFMLISLRNGWNFRLPGSYQGVITTLIKENSSLDSVAIADHYLQRSRALIAADPVRQAAIAQKSEFIKFVYPYIYAYSLIVTDWRFNCTNDDQWSLLQNQVDTYGYWFADRDSVNIYRAIRASEGINIPDFYPIGASHAFDLSYILNSQAKFNLGSPTEAQKGLSEDMLSYWTNFAKFGDPNSTDGSSDAVEWPRYSEGGDILRLETPGAKAVSINEFRDQHNCSFWANPPLRAAVR